MTSDGDRYILIYEAAEIDFNKHVLDLETKGYKKIGSMTRPCGVGYRIEMCMKEKILTSDIADFEYKFIECEVMLRREKTETKKLRSKINNQRLAHSILLSKYLIIKNQLEQDK